MKKLLVAVTAVALGSLAWGDNADFALGSSFNEEGWTVGEFPAATVEANLWSDTADKSVISDAKYTYSQNLVAGKPEEFAETEAGKYLAVKTPIATPLYRSVVSGGAKQDMAAAFYFDSLVHFTACDPDTVPDVQGENAKLAIWLKDLTEAETAQAATNLMITAGFFNGDEGIDQRTYDCGDISRFNIADGDDWCRLTIKAIAEVGDGSQFSGFVIFVNGIAAAHSDSIGVAGSVVDSLNEQAAQWNAQKMLFPSLVSQDPTITEVGFAGQGGVDNISFTRTAPSFAADFQFYTLEGAENIDSFAFGGQTWNAGDDPLQCVFDGTTSITVTDIVAAKGYFIDSTTEQITVEAGAELTVGSAVKPVNVYIGDQPYATLAEALAAVTAGSAAATIKLNADYDVDGTVEKNLAIDNVGKVTTLDLAGKKLGSDILVKSDLVIINSVEEKDVDDKFLGQYLGQITMSAGNLEIRGGFIAKDAEDCGSFDFVNYELLAYAGQFGWELTNQDDDIIYMADGLECVKTGDDFWTVQEKKVTYIDVPTAADGLVYNQKEQTGVADGEGYTLKGTTAATVAGEYTATAKLKEGYAWNGGLKGDQEIKWSIAKAELKDVSVTLNVTTADFDETKLTPGAYATPEVVGLDGVDAVEYTAGWNSDTVTAEGGTFTYTVEAKDDGNYTFEKATATLTVNKKAEDIPEVIPPAQQEAYNTWASGLGITGKDPVNADAFAIDLTKKELGELTVEEAVQKKLDEVILKKVDMAALVAALAAGEGEAAAKTAALAGITDYPKAQFSLVSTTIEGADTENAAFYKLSVSFKPAND